MLHRNVGRADRAVRLAIGIVGLPVGLFLLHGLAGAIPGLILAAVGFVGLASGQRLLSLARAFGLLHGTAATKRTVALTPSPMSDRESANRRSARVPCGPERSHRVDPSPPTP